MSGEPTRDEAGDDRFELRRMLRELEDEASEKPQSTVRVEQSEILEIIERRKKRDPHG